MMKLHPKRNLPTEKKKSLSSMIQLQEAMRSSVMTEETLLKTLMVPNIVSISQTSPAKDCPQL